MVERKNIFEDPTFKLICYFSLGAFFFHEASVFVLVTFFSDPRSINEFSWQIAIDPFLWILWLVGLALVLREIFSCVRCVWLSVLGLVLYIPAPFVTFAYGITTGRSGLGLGVPLFVAGLLCIGTCFIFNRHIFKKTAP
ncbi:MAG: hypothetical protein Q8R36_02170 [bacterium]|nr:hypothetical protein [bacterium]